MTPRPFPAPRTRSALAMAAVLAFALAPTLTRAQAQAPPPLISDFGRTSVVENAGVRPDPAIDYKVVMDVTEAGEAGAPPPALDRAARLANLLAQSGVAADHRHIVAVLHGAATAAVLNAAGLKARGQAPNPSAALIARLTEAGVEVHVCGQALAGARIKRSEVLPQVQVDLSALTTLSTLQLRGYALLPN